MSERLITIDNEIQMLDIKIRSKSEIRYKEQDEKIEDWLSKYKGIS